MISKQLSPFFIVGPGRSGTTLLRAMLDARPDTRIPGETHFYTTYRIENALRLHFLTKANYERAVAAYPSWRHVSYEDLNWHRFADIASALPPRRKSILLAYLAACAEKASAARFGEKTPGHVRMLDRIWQDFPGARVINVMRDPRGVAASYLGHDLYARVFGRDVTRAALKWREAAKAHRRAASGPNAAAYMCLRYEDLVREPEVLLTRVCWFLDLPHDTKAMSRYLAQRLEVPNPSNHRNIGKPVDETRTDKWRDVLASEDVSLVDALARPFLAEFAYRPEADRPLAFWRVQARLAQFRIRYAGYGGSRLAKSFFPMALR